MTSILVLLLGCAGENEPEERDVSPIGSPFPMDPSDTVVDNPNLVPGNLGGTIEFTANLPLIDSTCDNTFEVTGSPYTGYCPGCTFNFEVDVAETRDEGTNCLTPAEMAATIPGIAALYSQATFRLWLWQYSVVLQFSNYWTGYSWNYVPVNNDPALAWGVAYYGQPLVWPIAYKGSAYGTLVDVTSSTIDWTFHWEYYDTYYGTGLNEFSSVGHVYIVE
jgi:hypothetical protein